MARPIALEPAAINRALETLEGWTLDDGKLLREFRFASFGEAFGFMSRAALVAERPAPPPAWFNGYATVRVHLTTHDAGGLTELDLELARAMNAIAENSASS